MTGVSLNTTVLSLIVGNTSTLTATVTPSNATDKRVTWTSSDNSVATVSDGVVTAVNPGTATIIATTTNGKLIMCTVTVQPATVDVTGVSLSATSLSLTVGETSALAATVMPNNATDQSVSWESSNATVATVSDGVVTAVGVGTTTITVTASGGRTATCEVTVKGELAYVLSADESYYIVSGMGTCTDTRIVIPDTYSGLPVKEIGNKAFYQNRDIVSVTLGRNVTVVRRAAFAYCEYLGRITLSESLTTIENAGFVNCASLPGITIPDSVTGIGKEAFVGCSGLTNVTIGNGVTSIGVSAFSGCSGLTSVTIPNSVTSIGMAAFYGCSGLTSITIPFVGASKDGTTNTHFGYIFGAYSDSYNVDYVPTALKTVVITGGSIGSYAFDRCSDLTNVTIGNGVTGIGSYAFDRCSSLTSITIPDSVTSIGSYAFRGCTGLTSMTLPFVGATKDGTSNTHFGYIFGASSDDYNVDYVPTALKTVVITGGSIGSYAFYGCSSLTSVVFQRQRGWRHGSTDYVMSDPSKNAFWLRNLEREWHNYY